MCGDCFSSCNKDALQVKRKHFRKSGLTILIPVFILMVTSANAQWECPSRMGANLKPIGQSNFMWSSEVTTSGGFIGDYRLANLLVFGGLDYSINKHTLYIEGGMKNWIQKDTVETYSKTLLFGMREGYYKYSGDKNNLTIGLQSAKSDDYYLLNERLLGLNYKLEAGNFRFNLTGGTVLKEFARNGTFCSVGYMYNVVGGRQRTLVGTHFGQTNLAMLTIAYQPKKEDVNQAETSEFESAPVFDPFTFNSVGIVAYTEFGDWVNSEPFLSGLYANADIASITVKPEILYQSATDNQAILYSINADKQFEWSNNQMTKLFARYAGIAPIDKNAIAVNSFSNIFAGEVLRLDALELPFVQAGIKHSFPAIKTSLKLQMAMQTGKSKGYIADDFNSSPIKMQEFDLSVSKNIGKYLLVNGYAGYLQYSSLQISEGYRVYKDQKSPWGKIEIRFTF